MNKVELAKGVYYVGCQDWPLRDFHGYTTPRGVTYNSYLIVDEKVCLVDLVKRPFAYELLDRIAAVIDPAKIDYIVMNHVENDHASALPEVVSRLGADTEIFISAAGARQAEKLYGKYNYKVVKEGDSLSLGANTLQFSPIPMLHWPDSMISYLPEQQILFSNDVFGQHICTSKQFDDQNDISEVMAEAEKYYANILMPFGKLVVPALNKLSALPVRLVCPSHGVVWRSHIKDIVARYQSWGAGKTREKILVVYDTMWGATECMARAMVEGIRRAGADAKLHKLSACEQSQIAADLQEAAGLMCGSPTLNLGMVPKMGGFLVYLKGLKPTGRLATTFGAYGWSGGSEKDMEEMLQKTGMQLWPSLSLRWTPDKAEVAACEKFGYEFAMEALKNRNPM